MEYNLSDIIGASHLYYQQHIIDEFKIDYAEFLNRIGPYDVPGAMTKFADEIAALDEDSKTILNRALDLINNPQ